MLIWNDQTPTTAQDFLSLSLSKRTPPMNFTLTKPYNNNKN